MTFCIDVLNKEVKLYFLLSNFKSSKQQTKEIYNDYKAAYDYLVGTTYSLSFVPSYSIRLLSRQLLWLDNEQTINEVNETIKKLKEWQ